LPGGAGVALKTARAAAEAADAAKAAEAAKNAAKAEEARQLAKAAEAKQAAEAAAKAKAGKVEGSADDAGQAPLGAAEHKKNPRPSDLPKHEKGDTRRKRDRGGEKADELRRPKRRPPPGHKGPYPSKTTSESRFDGVDVSTSPTIDIRVEF
jgi:hypothetical protein